MKQASLANLPGFFNKTKENIFAILKKAFILAEMDFESINDIFNYARLGSSTLHNTVR